MYTVDILSRFESCESDSCDIQQRELKWVLWRVKSRANGKNNKGNALTELRLKWNRWCVKAYSTITPHVLSFKESGDRGEQKKERFCESKSKALGSSSKVREETLDWRGSHRLMFPGALCVLLYKHRRALWRLRESTVGLWRWKPRKSGNLMCCKYEDKQNAQLGKCRRRPYLRQK